MIRKLIQQIKDRIFWQLKPHVVTWYRGTYVVRKRAKTGRWAYLDAKSSEWWYHEELVNQQCVFGDKDAAVYRMNDYNQAHKVVAR